MKKLPGGSVRAAHEQDEIAISPARMEQARTYEKAAWRQRAGAILLNLEARDE